MNMRLSSFLYGILFVGIIGFDRLTKTLILNNLTDRCEVTPFLSFDLILNRGISWGIFHAADPRIFVFLTFIIMSITAVLVGYAYTRLKANYIIIGEVMVIAGSLSNIFDRFLYRGVIDFILISCGDWHFPLFNIADVSIVLGVLGMLIMSYKES
jgi:signal peptidase II